MIVTRRITKPLDTIKRIIDAINGKIDFVNNIDCKIIDVLDSGAANNTFTVDHNLGRIPTGYIWNIDQAGTVYDFSRATWDTVSMTLRCSAANAVLKLVVF